MKKGFSIIGVFAAASFGRMAAVLGIMAALELLSFWVFSLVRPAATFADASGNAFLYVIFALGYVAMYWALAWSSGKGSAYRYTMQRLRITERQSCVLQLLYHCLCFLLFVLVQAALLLAMAKIFEASPSYAAGPQGLLLDFRADAFLGSVIPLHNMNDALSLVLCIAAAASAATHMSVLLRNAAAPAFAYITAVFVIAVFTSSQNEGRKYYIVLLLICMVISICRAIKESHGAKPRGGDDHY